MRGFSKKDIFILPLFFLIAFCAMSSQQDTALADAQWQGVPSPPYDVINGGFIIQPDKYYNVVKGSTVLIKTYSARPIID